MVTDGLNFVCNFFNNYVVRFYHRLCPLVVVVVGLPSLNDFWGYADTHAWQVQREKPDQDPGFTPCARDGEVHFPDASAHQTWLWKWTPKEIACGWLIWGSQSPTRHRAEMAVACPTHGTLRGVRRSVWPSHDDMSPCIATSRPAGRVVNARAYPAPKVQVSRGHHVVLVNRVWHTHPSPSREGSPWEFPHDKKKMASDLLQTDEILFNEPTNES